MAGFRLRNIGKIERVLRVIIGILIIAYSFTISGFFWIPGLVGVAFIVTAFVRY